MKKGKLAKADLLGKLVEGFPVMVPVVSGGLDSVALTGVALELGAEVHPIFIRRGQTNKFREEDAINHFDEFFGSEYPEQYYPTFKAGSSMPPPQANAFSKEHGCSKEATYFCRNHAMGIVAVQYSLMLREVEEIDYPPPVILGSVISDRRFKDGRKQVVRAFEKAMRLAMPDEIEGKNFHYTAPFLEMGWDKKDYVLWLKENALDTANELHYTWSCFGRQKKQCGHCNPCEKRKQAFAEAGLEDKTPYSS
jgi:7-cyano-7-deazaguanine synthase